MPKKDYLTATDFYQFVQCPHWPYYKRFATQDEQALVREISDSEIKRMENGVAHELDVVQRLMKGGEVIEASHSDDAVAGADATMELMRKGVATIFQGTLTDGDWTGRPDLLERREGESSLGSWHYVPVDVKSTHALEKYQKLQLVFYATLLERAQGRFPEEPAIINGDGERISFDAKIMLPEFETCVVELERIRAGEKPDPVLRKSCYDTGPWGRVCEQYAKETNDIALLFNVDVKKLRLLRGMGVRTIQDAAEMDPVTLDGAAPGLRAHGLEVMKRQAQSLLTQSVIIREPIHLPSPSLEIHFDIESDPPNDVDYLYGFLIRQPDGSETYRPFVAETLAGEAAMWKSFLAWLETLPSEYVVYHYSMYEMTRLALMEKRYGGSMWLNLFRANMVDLKEIVTHSVTFPLYFYGLKYIAKFLGFSWIGDVTGGGQSVDVFEKYIETGDRALLDSIIQYNQDDVKATAHLKDWIVKYATEVTSYESSLPWNERT